MFAVRMTSAMSFSAVELWNFVSQTHGAAAWKRAACSAAVVETVRPRLRLAQAVHDVLVFLTNDNNNSITSVDWPAPLVVRVTPFSGRRPSATWGWRDRGPHTHSALLLSAKV